MIVVADSSPFIVLAGIDRVDILPAIFREVLIPTRVADELSSPKRPQGVRQFMSAPPSWLRIVTPSAMELIPGLHAGETAAVALALELRADSLIIDEYSGRKIATT
jgi:predicted nucleic acid-binding protein